MSQSWSNNNSDLPPPPPPPIISDSDALSDGEDDDIIEPNPNNWYFDKDRLENTPSRKLGIDADRELMYRQQSANFIQDMGQRLQVNQLCINTAIVYMHRFYMYHSFSIFSRNNVSTASIFLAAKVEEQPRKLEYVIKVAHYCLHRESIPSIDVKSEAYTTQCTDLVNTENILLQTLGFDVGIDHPHTHVVKCCQLVRASKDLAQTSYFMATNSLHLTTMCMQYRPSVVACVCIHLACKWSNWEIPRSKEGRDWYWYVDDTVTADQLEALTTEFLTIFNKSPSRLKKKIISLSAATSGSGGMNMSNFPSHFNFDAFNKQTANSSVPVPGPSKPRQLAPYSKTGPQQVPPLSAGIQPLLGRPTRPTSVPTREPVPLIPPHMSNSLKLPSHHGQPPQSNSVNKHGMHPSSTARPIPVHHSGTHSGSSHSGVPKDPTHPNKLPYPPPPPPPLHQTSHSSYPQHHGSRPTPHGLPGTTSGGSSGGQSHVSNSQSIHGQAHVSVGQKTQSQPTPLIHPMSSQQQQRPSASLGQPLKPLLPPGSLSMKHPHVSGSVSGNKIPGQLQQQPLVPPHSGQLKRPYSDMSRSENRSDQNASTNAKRDTLPGDVRRNNAPMPQPPPPPTKAQLQSLATQARAREKSEKMNAVQMAMLKKPHDLLTWAGSNKQPVPELPPHTLLQKPDSSHYPLPSLPPPPPSQQPSNPLNLNMKMEYSHVHTTPAPVQSISIPKHDFSVVSHSNHGNNTSGSAVHSSTAIPKNDFPYPFRPLSPIVAKNEYVPPVNVTANNVSAVKSEFSYNSKDFRKNDLGSLPSSNNKAEPPAIPPLLTGQSIWEIGMTVPRNDFSISLPSKNVKKEPLPPPPPPPSLNELSMPKLEPSVMVKSPNMALGIVDQTNSGNIDARMNSISTGQTLVVGTDQSSGSKKKKKKKEHKHKDRHKEKEEKKHKDKSEKKHRGDEDKKKHRDKDDKRPSEKEDKKHHKDKDDGKKHKKERHKDKTSREKHVKSSKEKHGRTSFSPSGMTSVPMITPQDDPSGSSKIKIVFGRGNSGTVGENSNDSNKPPKKQHLTASVLHY